MGLGESRLTLLDDGAGKYSMSSETRPKGIASIVYRGKISEQGNGYYADGRFVPVNYRRETKKGSEAKFTDARFNWNQGKLESSSSEGDKVFELKTGLNDPLSMQLVVMWDLINGNQPSEYSVFDGRKIKTFHVQSGEKEILKTALGDIETIKYTQQQPGKTRSTTFWFAPELNYIPVKVAQTKKGREVGRMELLSLE